MSDHKHDDHTHQHPTTFDEIIERGFPLRRTTGTRATSADHAHRNPIPLAPRLAAATGSAIRKNAADGFSPDEQQAFKTAVDALVADGTYLALIQLHMDMRHMMHGSMGEIGLYRFLAWHRRYLVEFERQLQRIDRVLRPTSTEMLGIPYWSWETDLPAWLDDFLPANDPVTGLRPDPRENTAPPEKATVTDIDMIVNGFQMQRTRIPGENDYIKFTYALEGFGRRPDGSRLPAHNHGHAWIGGIMNNSSTSPTDPAFWLHHAEVDRLWESWRQANSATEPPLNADDRVMDPWSESYDELLSVLDLGYSYDTLVT